MKPPKPVIHKPFAAEFCSGIVELNECHQNRLEQLLKDKIPEHTVELKYTHLSKHKIDIQGHDLMKQRYYHVRPKIR